MAILLFIVSGNEIFFVDMKTIIQNRLSHLLHQPQNKMQVMYGCQCRSGHFIGAEEVGEIGAGVVGAGVASAVFFYKEKFFGAFCIF